MVPPTLPESPVGTCRWKCTADNALLLPCGGSGSPERGCSPAAAASWPAHPSKEERNDDEPDHIVGEGGEGLVGSERRAGEGSGEPVGKQVVGERPPFPSTSKVPPWQQPAGKQGKQAGHSNGSQTHRCKCEGLSDNSGGDSQEGPGAHRQGLQHQACIQTEQGDSLPSGTFPGWNAIPPGLCSRAAGQPLHPLTAPKSTIAASVLPS